MTPFWGVDGMRKVLIPGAGKEVSTTVAVSGRAGHQRMARRTS